jgi:hypothetical protein
MPPNTSENVTIYQALTQTGDWCITAGYQSYAFITVTNNIDATLQINALNNIQTYKDIADRSNTAANQSNAISAVSLVSSFGALIVSILSYRTKRKESA